ARATTTCAGAPASIASSAVPTTTTSTRPTERPTSCAAAPTPTAAPTARASIRAWTASPAWRRCATPTEPVPDARRSAARWAFQCHLLSGRTHLEQQGIFQCDCSVAVGVADVGRTRLLRRDGVADQTRVGGAHLAVPRPVAARRVRRHLERRNAPIE